MTFKEAVSKGFSSLFDFSSRARRSEYWYYILGLDLIILVGGFILTMILTLIFGEDAANSILTPIFSIATFVLTLGVEVRRMHDIGKSGWALLISLIPIVGAIILLIWLCKDSQPGENQYGPNPKE